MTRIVGGFILVLLAATACGDDGSTSGTTAAPTTVPSTTAATTTTLPATTVPEAPGAGAVVPITTPPCDLLTADEVEMATGLTVTEVRDEPPIGCAFELDVEPGVHVLMTVEDGAGRLAGPANLFAEYGLLVDDGEAEPVDGIGEGALCCPFRAIAVDAGGGRFIAVGVGGGYHELAEPLEVLTELAEIALTRL